MSRPVDDVSDELEDAYNRSSDFVSLTGNPEIELGDYIDIVGGEVEEE